jgi:hypothetical protein
MFTAWVPGYLYSTWQSFETTDKWHSELEACFMHKKLSEFGKYKILPTVTIWLLSVSNNRTTFQSYYLLISICKARDSRYRPVLDIWLSFSWAQKLLIRNVLSTGLFILQRQWQSYCKMPPIPNLYLFNVMLWSIKRTDLLSIPSYLWPWNLLWLRDIRAHQVEKKTKRVWEVLPTMLSTW